MPGLLQTVCSPWATGDDLAQCPPGLDPSAVEAKLDAASDLLYRMSGRQWPGECDITVRPCLQTGEGGPVVVPVGWPLDPGPEGWWVPRGIASTLAVNCLGAGSCSCGGLSEVWLPGTVIDVNEVVVDGVTLSPAAYRVDDWRWLVRVDGGTWPCCQRLDLPDTAAGTWAVTYTYGGAPPPSGVDAAVALAGELARACVDGDDSCALPAKAVRAARRGVEFELQPADLLDEGRTGIFAVDLFLRAVNPHQLSTGSHVRSPDVARPRVAGSEWVS